MGTVKITPARFNGEVTIPPSKSQAHRAILCAALADGVSKISPVVHSMDMEATIGAVKALGAHVEWKEDVLTVRGGLFQKKQAEIDCIESGSTLRFLIPIAAAGGAETVFYGRGRLPQRPLGAFLNLLPSHGVPCESDGGLPLKIKGRLEPGVYQLAGNVSSQYVTGLLLALPLLSGDSEIILTTPLESKGYVDMTLDVMRSFGVLVEEREARYVIPGGQRYKNSEFNVESDWSQAAFFLIAGALNGGTALNGLSPSSIQGDKTVCELLREMGAEIKEEGSVLRAEKSELHGVTIDASQIPDLVPALAVACAFAKGDSLIHGAARLRVKESDRIRSTLDGLRAMGAEVEEREDGMLIHGGRPLHSGFIDGFNDHRIVMAFTMAASCVQGDTYITTWESVKKSYPGFFEDFKRIGGNADVISLGDEH